MKLPSRADRLPTYLSIVAAVVMLVIANACGQAATSSSTVPASGTSGHPKQTELCISIWNNSILMPLHRADNFVARKLIRQASASSVYFNRTHNACVATLFYEQPERFIQLIYFSAPDGGPIRVTYSGQDKHPAVPPGPRNARVRDDGSLALA
jgi:hypothetical protein